MLLRREVLASWIERPSLDLTRTDRVSVGIYPSVKLVRRVFDVECSIVHDISTLTTPQFHQTDNIIFHSDVIGDLESNEVTACVSQATLDDVHVHLGWPREKMVVTYSGWTWPEAFEQRGASEFEQDEVEPYLLVLGTREPRKNIARVLELLTLYPEILDTHRVVITGRYGWMQEESVPPSLTEAYAAKRVLFTGYVTELQKYRLLRGAAATIYPSYFEGFGLPVVEGMLLGTPCIAARTSSLVEVGGDVAFYFDPFSVRELYQAVRSFQALDAEAKRALRTRCREYASQFTREAMASRMVDGLAPAVRRVHAARLGAGGSRPTGIISARRRILK